MAAAPEPEELHNVVAAPIQRRSPAAPEIEIAWISMAMLDPRHAFQVAEEIGLTKDDFYSPSAELLFSILKEFWDENEPITTDILLLTLRARKVLDHTGGTIRGVHLNGQTFIFELETLCPTLAVCGDYAAIIKEKANRRRGTMLLGKLHETGFDESTPYEDWLSSAEKLAVELVRMRAGRQTHSRTMRELVKLAVASVDADIANPGIIDMPSGIPSLDYYTDGFIAPEITVIMAPPSDAKTALSLNIAEHLAVNCGKSVGIISLEMSDIQLTKRLLFAMARVDSRKIKREGGLTEDEHRALCNAAVRLADAPIFIRDDGALTTGQISATATAWKAKHGLDILIIDHAQLARAEKETENRTTEVEAVSNAMKPLAKRLNIPIILLSQVTKSTEGGKTKYSAKNSKAIEADCDNLWSISHERAPDESGRMFITQSWISLDKQRDRERYVTVPLIFNESIQRFAEKSKEQIESEQPALIDFGKLSKTRPKKSS